MTRWLFRGRAYRRAMRGGEPLELVFRDEINSAKKHVARRFGEAPKPKRKMARSHVQENGKLVLAACDFCSAP